MVRLVPVASSGLGATGSDWSSGAAHRGPVRALPVVSTTSVSQRVAAVRARQHLRGSRRTVAPISFSRASRQPGDLRRRAQSWRRPTPRRAACAPRRPGCFPDTTSPTPPATRCRSRGVPRADQHLPCRRAPSQLLSTVVSPGCWRLSPRSSSRKPRLSRLVRPGRARCPRRQAPRGCSRTTGSERIVGARPAQTFRASRHDWPGSCSCRLGRRRGPGPGPSGRARASQGSSRGTGPLSSFSKLSRQAQSRSGGLDGRHRPEPRPAFRCVFRLGDA